MTINIEKEIDVDKYVKDNMIIDTIFDCAKVVSNKIEEDFKCSINIESNDFIRIQNRIAQIFIDRLKLFYEED